MVKKCSTTWIYGSLAIGLQLAEDAFANRPLWISSWQVPYNKDSCVIVTVDGEHCNVEIWRRSATDIIVVSPVPPFSSWDYDIIVRVDEEGNQYYEQIPP